MYKPDTKLSKEVKSNNFHYHKGEKAITYWGSIEKAI